MWEYVCRECVSHRDPHRMGGKIYKLGGEASAFVQWLQISTFGEEFVEHQASLSFQATPVLYGGGTSMSKHRDIKNKSSSFTSKRWICPWDCATFESKTNSARNCLKQLEVIFYQVPQGIERPV